MPKAGDVCLAEKSVHVHIQSGSVFKRRPKPPIATLPTIHMCAAEPQSSCDPGWHLKIRLTCRPHAAWRVRNRVVLFAIGGLRRAGTTAKAECFEMLRIADRPAAHAGPQLIEFDGNHHQRRTIARFPIDYHVRCNLPTAAESLIACGPFSRFLDFRHFKSLSRP